MTVLTFIALGANLGDPRRNLEEALQQLQQRAKVHPLQRAGIYRSKPLGPPGQPDYLNTAIFARTSLSPQALLAHLKEIEADLGRTLGVRWGPRIIDLDILLYGDQQVQTETLTIPHRELANRRFVLQPLLDLAPEHNIPGLNRSVRALLDGLEGSAADLLLLEPPASLDSENDPSQS